MFLLLTHLHHVPVPVVDPVTIALEQGVWSCLLKTRLREPVIGRTFTAEVISSKISGTGKTVTFKMRSLQGRPA